MTQLFTDNFTRANGGLGANWTTTTSEQAPQIVSNEAADTNVAVGGARYTATAAPAAQYGEVTLGSVVSTTSDEGVGAAACIQSAAQSHYLAQVNTVQSRLYKVVAGAFTQLGSDGAAGATNDIYRTTRTAANAVSVSKNTVTIIGPVTDSSMTSGDVGIWCSNSGGPGTIKLFAGGDLLSGASLGAPLAPLQLRSGSGALAMHLVAPAPAPQVSASGNTFSDSVAESIAFADSQSATAQFTVTEAEGIAFADSQAASAQFTSQRDESIAFTDAQTSNFSVNVQRDESVTFTDTQVAGASFGNVQRDESIAFTDSQTGVFAISAQTDESIAFADSQSSNATFAGTTAESIAFTDAQTVQATLNVARAESIAFTDSQTGAGTFQAQRDEAVAFSDSQDATVTTAGTNQTDESIAFTDAQDTQAILNVTVAESIAFADQQQGTTPNVNPVIVDGGWNFGSVGLGPFVKKISATRERARLADVTPVIVGEQIELPMRHDAQAPAVFARRERSAHSSKPIVLQLKRTTYLPLIGGST